MSSKRWARLLALLLAFGLVAAACGDSDDDDAGEETEAEAGDEATEETEAPAEDATDETEAPAETEAPSDTEPAGDGDAAAAGLAACPNPLIIQTDWFPEPEHGATYQLTAGEGDWDEGASAFVGPLWADPSIEVQIRPGGPFIGFQTTVSVMYQDESIFFGYTSIDSAIANVEDFPTVSVVAPLIKNPQIIMWDPDTYPDIESFSDIGETGAIVNVFSNSVYMEYLISTGQLTADQEDPSYDASPTRFVAEEGAIFQQGFATQEPWNYENLFEEWGKPVDFLLIHDSGYQPYSQPLGVRADLLEDPAVQECLTALVPVVQQSIIDFQTDPQPVIDAIERALIDIDDFWQLSQESMANTVAVMAELEIVGNEGDGVVGDFNLDRVTTLIEQLDTEVGSVDIPEGLTPDAVVTNEFIDTSIGL